MAHCHFWFCCCHLSSIVKCGIGAAWKLNARTSIWVLLWIQTALSSALYGEWKFRQCCSGEKFFHTIIYKYSFSNKQNIWIALLESVILWAGYENSVLADCSSLLYHSRCYDGVRSSRYSSRAYCKLTFGPFEQQLRDRQTSASTRCPWTDTVTDREPRVTREGYRCIKHHRNQLTGRLYTQGVHVRYGFM